MKRCNGGLVYMVAISVAILFGCLAMSAHGRSSKLLKTKLERMTGVYVAASSGSSNTSAYHTEINSLAADGEAAESKLTLIFCTEKCYCHSDNRDDICYCWQNPPGPVCYGKLEDCQANCAVCNPKCPPGTAAGAAAQQLLHATTTTNANATL